MSRFGELYVTQLYRDEMYRRADQARLVHLARRAQKARATPRNRLGRAPVAGSKKS